MFLKQVRPLVDEGEADMAAGNVFEYANADELTQDIVKQGMEF